MRIGDFYNYNGTVLRAEKKDSDLCFGCYFYEKIGACEDLGFNCYRIKLVEVKKPHLYGDFTAFQKVAAFVKEEISVIETDVPDMTEGEKKENTRVLLEQYQEILRRMEG